jgi:hypothetical protein
MLEHTASPTAVCETCTSNYLHASFHEKSLSRFVFLEGLRHIAYDSFGQMVTQCGKKVPKRDGIPGEAA